MLNNVKVKEKDKIRASLRWDTFISSKFSFWTKTQLCNWFYNQTVTLAPYFINVGEWIQVKTVTNKCNYRLLHHSQFTRVYFIYSGKHVFDKNLDPLRDVLKTICSENACTAFLMLFITGRSFVKLDFTKFAICINY